jgi:pimeloyl-ACP methyl ester carboxylesterase
MSGQKASSRGRVLVVPGLAVHEYAESPVERLRARGFDAELLPAPAWRGVPDEIERYGRRLADDLNRDGRRVAVLVGLSAGTQAAAVAATLTPLVDHLLLVSPTIDPSRRSMPRQLGSWLKGDPHEAGAFSRHLSDWARAGVPRILRGFRTAIGLPLEDVLPQVRARLTIVHAEFDPLTSYDFASRLVGANSGRLLVAPGSSHSWPQDDPDGFAELIMELTDE